MPEKIGDAPLRAVTCRRPHFHTLSRRGWPLPMNGEKRGRWAQAPLLHSRSVRWRLDLRSRACCSSGLRGGARSRYHGVGLVCPLRRGKSVLKTVGRRAAGKRWRRGIPASCRTAHDPLSRRYHATRCRPNLGGGNRGALFCPGRVSHGAGLSPAPVGSPPRMFGPYARAALAGLPV